MSNHTLPDSQGDYSDAGYDNPLDWNSVELIRKNIADSKLAKREGRLLKQLKELQPLNFEFLNLPAAGERKARPFGQRHCLTCDLSGYLGLASRDHLERLEDKKYSEKDIFHMLNRKFTKLRKFNDRNGLKIHRFKKKSFNEYVKGYQGYMQSGGKRGKTVYEADKEDYSNDKREQRKYHRLINQPIEYLTSTDGSHDEEESTPLTEHKSNSASLSHKRTSENNSKNINSTLSDGNLIVKSNLPSSRAVSPIRENTSTSPVMQASSDFDNERILTTSDSETSSSAHSTPSTGVPRMISSSIPKQTLTSSKLSSPARVSSSISNIPDSPSSPVRSFSFSFNPLSQSGTAVTSINIRKPKPIPRPPASHDFLHQNLEPLRTRRRTYAQQHPFNCDLAIFLGLSTAGHLNELYADGKTEVQIMNYLESRYEYHRQRRKRQRVAYGPFEPPTLKIYMERDSSKRNEAQKKANQHEHQDNADRDSQIREFVDDDDNGFETSDDDYVYDADDADDADEDPLHGTENSTSPYLNNNKIEGSALDEIRSYSPNSSLSNFVDSISQSIKNPSLATADSIRGYDPNPSDSNTDSDSGDADAEDNSSKASNSDSFVYRKRKYKKTKALFGVLPASFLKIQALNNKTKSASPSISRHKRKQDDILKPGVARKKKLVRRSNNDDGLNQFLVADDEVDLDVDNELVYRNIDVNPVIPTVSINSINNGHFGYDNGYSGYKSDDVIDLQNLSDDQLSSISTLSDDFDDGSDDGIGIDDYDMFKNEMNLRDCDDDGGAEEERSSGINYMLSRGESRSTSTGSKSKSSNETNKNSGRNFFSSKLNPNYTISTRKRNAAGVKKRRPGLSVVRGRRGLGASRKKSTKNTTALGTNVKTGNDSVQSRLIGLDPIWLDDDIQTISTDDNANFLERSSSTLKIVSDIYAKNQGTKSLSNSKGTLMVNQGDIVHSLPSKSKNKKQKQNRTPTTVQSTIDNMFYRGRGKIIATMQVEGTVADPSPIPCQSHVQTPVVSHTPRRALVTIDRFHNTIRKLESNAKSSSSSIDPQLITVQMFEALQPKSTSFSSSFLFRQCILPSGGKYFKNDNIVFEFSTVNFSIGISNYDECSKSINSLFKSILTTFKNTNSLDSKSQSQLRKCYIRLVQLCWNLSVMDLAQLKHIGKLLLNSSNLLLDYVTSYRQILFHFPYFLLFVKLIDKLLRESFEGNTSSSVYESLALKFQRKIIMASCSLSANHFYKCLRGSGVDGSSSYHMESMSTFTKMCGNPWSQVASLSKEYQFKVQNVTGFLYFLQSRSAVIVDWEYYIQEVNKYMKNGSSEKQDWKELFVAVRRIIYDLNWQLEEKLLLKLYKLLSFQRFENVGSTRATVLFYSSLPFPSIFTQTEGCLDCFLKLLILFVSKFMNKAKENSLVEKLNPVGDISTCTNDLLKNRANLLLVMVMLFKKDFVQHFGSIFRVFSSFKTLDAYKNILELLRILTKTYHKQFDKFPIGLIKGCLSKIISVVNESITYAEGLSTSLSFFFDTVSNHFNFSVIIDKVKFEQIVDIAVITLKLRKCDHGTKTAYPVETIIGIIQRSILSVSAEAIMIVKSKLENDLIGSVKSIILNESIKNEYLKRNCFSLWTDISSRLRTPVDSLIHLQWAYFGGEELRSNYQLLFFANLIESYGNINFKSNKSIVIEMLMSNLPLKLSPYFHKYLSILCKQPYMRDLLAFKSGVNVAELSEFEFKKNRIQVTIKILSRIIIKSKKSFLGNEEESYIKYLEIFLDSLNKEYLKDKDDLTSDHSYSQYAIRMLSYVNNVASALVRDIPSYISLKHELVITDKNITLGESIDSIDSVNDLVVLISGEYITAFVSDRLPAFENEAVELLSDPSNNLNENKRISLLYPVIMITAFHFDSLHKDKTHWFHIRNWLSILVKLVRCKSFLTLSDTLFLIKLLLLSGSSSDYKSSEFQVCIDVIISFSEEIIVAISHSLIGFEDRELFLDHVCLLNALGSKDSDLIKPRNSLYDSEINGELSKLFFERAGMLQRHICRASNYFVDYTRSLDIHEMFTRLTINPPSEKESLADKCFELSFL